MSDRSSIGNPSACSRLVLENRANKGSRWGEDARVVKHGQLGVLGIPKSKIFGPNGVNISFRVSCRDDDISGVSVCQALDYRQPNCHGSLDGQRSAGKTPRERFATEKFHDEKWGFAIPVEILDGADIRRPARRRTARASRCSSPRVTGCLTAGVRNCNVKGRSRRVSTAPNT
jgi:hypothetical protein